MYDGATLVATVALDVKCTGTWWPATLAAGVHQLSAVYIPDANHQASSSVARTVTIA